MLSHFVVSTGNSVVILIIDGSTPTDEFDKAKESAILTIRKLKPDAKFIVYIIIYNDNKITQIVIKNPKDVEPSITQLIKIKHVKSKPNTLLIFQVIEKLNPGDNTQVIPLGGLKLPENPTLKSKLLSIIQIFVTKNFHFTFVIEDPNKVPQEWKTLIPEITFVPHTKIEFVTRIIKSKL